jgi:hypothetical protein
MGLGTVWELFGGYPEFLVRDLVAYGYGMLVKITARFCLVHMVGVVLRARDFEVPFPGMLPGLGNRQGQAK